MAAMDARTLTQCLRRCLQACGRAFTLRTGRAFATLALVRVFRAAAAPFMVVSVTAPRAPPGFMSHLVCLSSRTALLPLQTALLVGLSLHQGP